jgi:hypothetical protein
MLILSIPLKYISNQPYFKNEAVSVSWDLQLVNVTLKNTELRLFKPRTMVSILIIYAWIFWFADYTCTFKFTHCLPSACTKQLRNYYMNFHEI